MAGPQLVEHVDAQRDETGTDVSRGLSARWVVLGALALGVAIELLRWRLRAGGATSARHVARARRLKPWQKLAAGTLAAAVILFAVLAIVELWLRRPSSPRPGADPSTRGLALMLVDEATCYGGFAPHARQEFAREGTPLRHRYVADREGFRQIARRVGRPAACRVLALGDSFTVGLYVEAAEAWPAALEARLRERGFSVQVDNGGVQGHTITHERIEALSRWASLRPRVVVVARTNNDLSDVVLAQESGCRIGGPLPAELVPALPARLTDLRLVAGAMEARARVRVMTTRLSAVLRGAGGADPGATRCGAAQEVYLTEAADLARGVSRNGGHLLFAELERPICGVSYDSPEGDAFERRLAEAVSGAGARTLDLRAALDGQGARLTPWDSHPSPRGYAEVAAGLADALAASGWLDGCR